MTRYASVYPLVTARALAREFLGVLALCGFQRSDASLEFLDLPLGIPLGKFALGVVRFEPEFFVLLECRGAFTKLSRNQPRRA